MKKDNLSRFFKQQRMNQEEKWMAVTYDKDITPMLSKELKKQEFRVIGTSRMQQLKSILSSTKDKKRTHEKNGVYKVTCSHCEITYIGQTKRLVTTRRNNC